MNTKKKTVLKAATISTAIYTAIVCGWFVGVSIANQKESSNDTNYYFRYQTEIKIPNDVYGGNDVPYIGDNN